jgi:hypothetical protein
LRADGLIRTSCPPTPPQLLDDILKWKVGL